MGRVSFIDRVQPHRSRSKLIVCPFRVEGEGEPPKIRVKVLGQDALEAAYLATVDHFRGMKRKHGVTPEDSAFVQREHVELVWRAYEDPEGAPLAETAEDLGKQPSEIIAPLYASWSAFQAEVTIRPLKQSELDELVDGLKKNTLSDLLPALPSSWLIELVTTLASQLVASTPEKPPGS